jgi:hypothetical protein
MADPQDPRYGPSFDPNAGGQGTPDPDHGSDLGYLVPTVSVGWDTPPSYNLDPPDPGGNHGDENQNVEPCGPITVHLGSMRSAETSMLGASRDLANDYESLRSKVMAAKDTVFGQTATIQQITGGQSGVDGNSYNGSGAGVRQEQTVASPVQDTAKQFADSINPAQEKVLWQIANTIEIVGEYIGAWNRAGQTYARADRLSVFPDPPPNPVTNA